MLGACCANLSTKVLLSDCLLLGSIVVHACHHPVCTSFDINEAVGTCFEYGEFISFHEAISVEDVCLVAVKLDDALFILKSFHAEAAVETLLKDERAEL